MNVLNVLISKKILKTLDYSYTSCIVDKNEL